MARGPWVSASHPNRMRLLDRVHRLVTRPFAEVGRGSSEEELHRISTRLDGVTRYAAIDLKSMRTVGFEADVPTPMASTVKIAVAIEVLARADAGEIGLDDMIAIEPRHLRPGHGLIASRIGAPGVSLSIRRLIRLMLAESDNTATDVLFDLVEGPSAVQDRLRSLGIDGMRVDRTILEMMSDRRGIHVAAPGGEYSLEQWKSNAARLSKSELAAAGRAFVGDHRDTTTPLAMARLLVAIATGVVASPGHLTILRDCLGACSTGARRIRSGVPAGARVENKTGSLVGVVSADAGIVTLPTGDQIALAVFVMGSTASAEEQDRVISDLARTILRWQEGLAGVDPATSRAVTP